MGITLSVQQKPLSREGGKRSAAAVVAVAGDFTGRQGQLFLECTGDGRIVWMSDKARQRLGDAASLPEGVEVEGSAEPVRRFLSDCQAADTLAGLLHRADGTAVPVRFSCLTRSASRVVLSAEVRERATDNLGLLDDELFWMQSVVLENYFRLLRVQQSLDSRLRRARQNPGLTMIALLERERARLARELHSGAGQPLSAINLYLELIAKQRVEMPAEMREYLDRIGKLAREAGAEVRGVSHQLHPHDWQNVSLAEALENLWQNSGIPETFQASLEIHPPVTEPPQAVRAVIYRSAQEGLANAIRHSGAARIRLELEARDGHIRLGIEDDGKGFDAAARPSSGGIGLRAIREQVEGLGGEVHIRSGPEGTKLEVSVPLEPANE